MEQKFGKKNYLVIGALVVLIAFVALIAAVQTRPLNPTLGELDADPTASPAAEPTAEAQAPVPSETKAFLVVSVAGEMYEPIPLDGKARYTVTRGDKVNVIEVTGDSVTMHSSTCDNQDCVLQGAVTLENREDRVLKNMILCLPNEVVLELYTREEIAALLLGMAGVSEGGND